MHLIVIPAQGLDPVRKHVLELAPVLSENQEVRIESVCVAGNDSPIIQVTSSNR